MIVCDIALFIVFYSTLVQCQLIQLANSHGVVEFCLVYIIKSNNVQSLLLFLKKSKNKATQKFLKEIWKTLKLEGKKHRGPFQGNRKLILSHDTSGTDSSHHCLGKKVLSQIHILPKLMCDHLLCDTDRLHLESIKTLSQYSVLEKWKQKAQVWGQLRLVMPAFVCKDKQASLGGLSEEVERCTQLGKCSRGRSQKAALRSNMCQASWRVTGTEVKMISIGRWLRRHRNRKVSRLMLLLNMEMLIFNLEIIG